MRTHLRHRICGGDVVGDQRQVVTRPCDAEWPRDKTIRVPYCETCRTIVDVTECDDERIQA